MKKLTLTALRTLEAESKKVTTTCRAKAAKAAKRKKKETTKCSPRARKIAAAIKKTGFCGIYQRGVVMIVEAVIGEKLPPTATSGGRVRLPGFFVKGAVIVCTDNPNSHNYGRKPALLLKRTENGPHLRMSGIGGNNLPEAYETESPIRYATNAEVVKFFAAIRTRIRAKQRVDYPSR